MIKTIQHNLNYINIQSREEIYYFPMPIYITLTDHSIDEDEEDKMWFVSVSNNFSDFINQKIDLKIYEISEKEYYRLKSILDMISTLSGQIK